MGNVMAGERRKQMSWWGGVERKGNSLQKGQGAGRAESEGVMRRDEVGGGGEWERERERDHSRLVRDLIFFICHGSC